MNICNMYLCLSIHNQHSYPNFVIISKHRFPILLKEFLEVKLLYDPVCQSIGRLVGRSVTILRFSSHAPIGDNIFLRDEFPQISVVSCLFLCVSAV